MKSSNDNNNNNNNIKNTKINCMQCKYFSLTWEPKHPRMCRLYGFKTSGMPSDTVYKSSGVPCDGFVPKTEIKKN
jgi:hypothetical protein